MMILGYWDIRGVAHSIRLLLEYTGTPYEETRYVTGGAPDYDKSQWLDVKETLGLDFPNMPYLLDGDVKLSQSNAILRYIARKHGLCGELEEEQIRVDLVESHTIDFRMSLLALAYNPLFITFADFLMYDVLDQHRMLEPKCLQSFKNLKDFLTRFEALPPVAAYMKSPRFMKTPIYNRMAAWSNCK
ncbi:glutathione S-transferase Mu 1-like isoform X3 [Ascaphus truei]|uniref:glutathione S-transferase Mu 1-like isoform X3 n=1 Tax=Ascaphus truei TaxID=8439 RepID=UPI003F59AC2F